MAKKKPSLFDYYSGGGKLGKALDRYGVEGASFGGRPGEGGEPRSMADVDRDLAKAAMNDYDTRRTMEAQAMAGKKNWAAPGVDKIANLVAVALAKGPEVLPEDAKW